MKDVVEVLKVRRYKAGYEVREEKVLSHDEGMPKGDTLIIKSAYTPSGVRIGTPKNAYFLCKTKGINPEKSKTDHDVCSIGFCETEQKWYGWSHRAIFGFGVGDVVAEGDCTNSSGWTDKYLKDHPEDDLSLPVGFTAKTLEDAKRMAVAFAESVS